MSAPREETGLQKLLRAGPLAVNVGLRGFAEALRAQGAKVVHVHWKPPVDEDRELADLLDELR